MIRKNYQSFDNRISTLWLVLADFPGKIKLGAKSPTKDDLIKAFQTLNLKATSHA